MAITGNPFLGNLIGSSTDIEFTLGKLREMNSAAGNSFLGNLIGSSTDIEFTLGKLREMNSAAEMLTETFASVFRNYELIENSLANASRLMGGNRIQAEQMKEGLAEARLEVMRLGGTFEDVRDIQVGIVKELQTQTIINSDAIDELYAAGAMVSDSLEGATAESIKMAKNFKDIGFSLYDVSNNIFELNKQARSIGATTQATYTQLMANIERINTYNFRTGIEGVSRMAAQAASLRINMSDALNFAEKIFSPEGAVEAAAAFQRLGVQIPSLLDPYKLLDMARNAPEELQAQMVDLSKTFVEFDEINNRFRILPGAQETIREIANVLGMSATEFSKLAINAGKVDEVLNTIDFGRIGLFETDDKDMELMRYISGIAEMEGGEFKVSMDGQKIAVEDLTMDQLSKLREAMESSGKDTNDLLRESNSDFINFRNDFNTFVKMLPENISIGIALSESVNKGIKGISGLGTESIDIIVDTIKEGFQRGGVNTEEGLTSGIIKWSDETITGALGGLFKDIEDIKGTVENNPLFDIINDMFGNKPVMTPDDFYVSDNEVIIPDKDDNILGFKEGGVISEKIRQIQETTIQSQNTTNNKTEVGGELNVKIGLEDVNSLTFMMSQIFEDPRVIAQIADKIKKLTSERDILDGKIK